MDYLRSFAISATGMSGDRLRLEAAALNLSHANSPQSTSAAAFHPVRAVPAGPASREFEGHVTDILQQAPQRLSLAPQAAPPRRVHEPAHPLADADGYLAFPGVDTATEMVSLMTAMRSYEANVVALNTARGMALKTLDIGRGA